MQDTFRERTISGLSWRAISQLCVQLLNVPIGIALARLLTPKEFGFLGMVGVLVGFAAIFGDLGLGAAVIQKQDTEDRHYSSIFWINIAVGISMMSIFVICAPWIARFYNEPILTPLTIVLSVNFLVASLNMIQTNLFQKNFNFKYLAVVNIVSAAIYGCVAITMALLGCGVWSLAVSAIISGVIGSTLTWHFSDWRPTFLFDWKAVKDLLGFGSNLFGFTIFNYCVRNADNLLIGRFLGSSALGLYSRAYSLMLLPLTNISNVVGSVMFPALSSIQKDKPRISRVYLKMTRNIALISFPIMCGLLVVSESFVLAVFGLKWRGMIPILQVFCLLGMMQSIATMNGAIYLSLGRVDLQFRVGGTFGIVGVVAMIIGLRWGIKGVAYCYTAVSMAAAYPSIRIAVSQVGITFKQVARNLASIFCCAAVMATVVWWLGSLLPRNWGDWMNLAVQVPVGVLVYMLMIHFFKVQAYVEMVELLKERWQKKGEPTPVSKAAKDSLS